MSSIADVYVVFADDNIYDDVKSCDQGRHLYGIFEKEKDAMKIIKKLNHRNSMYKDAFYETWAVQ
jgi:hypothetical protein